MNNHFKKKLVIILYAFLIIFILFNYFSVEISDVKAEDNLTNISHKSYIIYFDEKYPLESLHKHALLNDPEYLKSIEAAKQESEALKEILKQKYGKEEDISITGVSSAKNFIDAWNSLPFSESEPINEVMVMGHGTPTEIGNSKSTVFFAIDDIDKLSKKKINTLNIISCNSGLLEYKNSNLANKFLKTQNVKKVIAYDGEIGIKRNRFSHIPLMGSISSILVRSSIQLYGPQDKFNELKKSENRKPLFKLTYTIDEIGNVRIQDIYGKQF